MEESIEKIASFVSQVYAKFPRANEQQRKELIANNILIDEECEQLSEVECDHFEKALKEKIIAVLTEKKSVKISTRYYPEEILKDVCEDIFINQNQLGWVFPHKTSATIELIDNKFSLIMNFQEKIYHI
ncbi:MAG: hypothetical protein H0X29_05465 [Parachlamydiaceae bacterium]|nr:hypothetical protein [Parachlamydiaceae bacterium]